MRSEIKFGLTFLYPDETKKLKLLAGTDLYSVVVLAKDDVAENYEEVDELWMPDIVEIPDDGSGSEDPDDEIVLEPDAEGKITYDEAQKLVNTLKTVQSRVLTLQETNDMLTECLLEMSEVIYSE
jgi:hypothetical protein